LEKIETVGENSQETPPTVHPQIIGGSWRRLSEKKNISFKQQQKKIATHELAGSFRDIETGREKLQSGIGPVSSLRV